MFCGKQLLPLFMLFAVQRYLAGEVLRPGTAEIVRRRMTGTYSHCECIVFHDERCDVRHRRSSALPTLQRTWGRNLLNWGTYG